MATNSIVDDLLRQGDLDGARAALVDAVKRTPSDAATRMFLWQLMALSGEWDKAQTQLRALAQLSPEAQMLATVYSQAIDAERQRAEAYAGKAPFPVLVASSDWINQLAEGLTLQCAGQAKAGEELRDAAFDAVGDTPGEVDGEAFLWIADSDARLGPCFEAVVAGRWGLAPFEAIASIKTEGPRDLRDAIWLPVEMALRSGQSAAALLPVRYPGSEAGDAEVRLARSTAWNAGPNGDLPAGQRVWMTDKGAEIGILDFRVLTMA